MPKWAKFLIWEVGGVVLDVPESLKHLNFRLEAQQLQPFHFDSNMYKNCEMLFQPPAYFLYLVMHPVPSLLPGPFLKKKV